MATQMLVSILGNLIANGRYKADLARTNVLDAIDQGTRVSGAEHHGELTDIAKAYLDIVDRAEAKWARS